MTDGPSFNPGTGKIPGFAPVENNGFTLPIIIDPRKTVKGQEDFFVAFIAEENQLDTEQVIKYALKLPEERKREWLNKCHEKISDLRFRLVNNPIRDLQAERELEHWVKLATALQVSLGIIKEGEAYKPPTEHNGNYADWFNDNTNNVLQSERKFLEAILNNNNVEEGKARQNIEHYLRSAVLSRQFHGGPLQTTNETQKEFNKFLTELNQIIDSPQTQEETRIRLIALRKDFTNIMCTLSIGSTQINPE